MNTRGCLSIVFDDGYTQVFNEIVPMLRRLHIPAVFAVPLKTAALEKESGLPITSWQRWLALAGPDFEIAAHSRTHIDLTRLAPSALTNELAIPHQQLNATTVVYPGGAHNDNVVQEARRFYSAGRTVVKGFESLPPRDPLRLRTYNYTQHNFSTAKANTWATLAYLRNAWLIETFHAVGEAGSSYPYTVTPRQLERHLNFIKKLPLAVRTIHQVVSDSQ